MISNTFKNYSLFKHFNNQKSCAENIGYFLETSGLTSIVYNAMQLSKEAEGNWVRYQELISISKILSIIENFFCEGQSLFSTYLGRRNVDSDIAIIECGAHQGYQYFSSNMSGAIAYLFAKEKIFGVPYFAYDPKITKELITTIETNCQGDESSPYTPEIYTALRDFTLDSYDELRDLVLSLQKTKLPIIISKSVLSAPNIWLDRDEFRSEFPFWTLPGLHIHNAELYEIETNRRISHINEVIERNNSVPHIDAFKKKFGINPESIDCYLDRSLLLDEGRTGVPFEVTYYWLNQ